MRTVITLVAAGLAAATLTASVADAADYRWPRHRHRHVVRLAPLVPPGYAYGGYGNGPGPGWDAGGYGPGYGYGIAQGYGYVPADGPYTGLDLAD